VHDQEQVHHDGKRLVKDVPVVEELLHAVPHDDAPLQSRLGGDEIVEDRQSCLSGQAGLPVLHFARERAQP
jgi:hypothetical protein